MEVRVALAIGLPRVVHRDAGGPELGHRGAEVGHEEPDRAARLTGLARPGDGEPRAVREGEHVGVDARVRDDLQPDDLTEEPRGLGAAVGGAAGEHEPEDVHGREGRTPGRRGSVRDVPNRLELEADRVARRAEKGDPGWPAQLAVALVIGLTLTLSEQVTVGPTWVLPALEAVLLVVLVVVRPNDLSDDHPRSRRLAMAVTGFISLANVVSLGLLVHYLVTGGHASGRQLIGSGAVLWAANVLLFAVWYWELDGGGPAARFRGEAKMQDFSFPQNDNPSLGPEGWRPGFLDYLYVSLTNATAFSPTDTMPLTHSAKALMGAQSVTALLTVGLVIARAVNILG